MSDEGDKLISDRQDVTNDDAVQEARKEQYELWGVPLNLMFMEFIATLLFVFVGCAASVSNSILTFNVPTAGRYVTVSLAHGLAATGLLFALGSDQENHPGHFNPALTFASLFIPKLKDTSTTPPVQALLLFIGQLTGAAVGAGLVVAAIPEAKKSSHNVGIPELGENVKAAEAFLCEVVLTFFLTVVFFVVSPAYTKPSTGLHSQRNNAPLALGFTITVCYLAGFAISGSCMNPARSFGPSLASSSFTDQWIFWIGPLLGAGLGAGLFKLIRSPNED